MDAYSRILVPTDMSDFAAQAVRLAARFGSRLTLLFADEISYPVDVLEVPIGYYLAHAPESRVQLEERLRKYAAEVLPGVPVETMVVQDSPARAIVHTARELNADLVVMGTHGRHGWRRALLGSVAESVLRAIDRPLLTVTPDLAADGVRNIVCPVSFTYIAREALRHAATLALAFDATLHVVYVAESAQPPEPAEVESAFSLWVDPLVRDRARYRVLTQGDAAQRVLGAANDAGADLIVLGGPSRRITQFARCPVMTVAPHSGARSRLRPRLQMPGPLAARNSQRKQ